MSLKYGVSINNNLPKAKNIQILTFFAILTLTKNALLYIRRGEAPINVH